MSSRKWMARGRKLAWSGRWAQCRATSSTSCVWRGSCVTWWLRWRGCSSRLTRTSCVAAVPTSGETEISDILLHFVWWRVCWASTGACVCVCVCVWELCPCMGVTVCDSLFMWECVRVCVAVVMYMYLNVCLFGRVWVSVCPCVCWLVYEMRIIDYISDNKNYILILWVHSLFHAFTFSIKAHADHVQPLL